MTMIVLLTSVIGVWVRLKCRWEDGQEHDGQSDSREYNKLVTTEEKKKERP